MDIPCIHLFMFQCAYTCMYTDTHRHISYICLSVVICVDVSVRVHVSASMQVCMDHLILPVKLYTSSQLNVIVPKQIRNILDTILCTEKYFLLFFYMAWLLSYSALIAPPFSLKRFQFF